MPQRLGREVFAYQDVEDATPAGSVQRNARYGPPMYFEGDRMDPPRIPMGGLFGGEGAVELPPAAWMRPPPEEYPERRAQSAERRERRRLRAQERGERYDMYGEDGRARDHMLRRRMNRRHPPMFPSEIPDDFWREGEEQRERRAAEEEIREDNEIGRMRAAARRRNEEFDEQVARNVRRRTTSEGHVIAHARQAG